MLEILKTDAFEIWFGALKDRRAKGRILMRLRRMELGNPGVVAPVGMGMSEMNIDYGPGYRIYFKQVGVEAFLILSVATSHLRCAMFDTQSVWLVRRSEMAVATSKWDVVDYLESEEAIAGYLEAVFEDGDPHLIAAALGDVARAMGISVLAERTGLPGDHLLSSLCAEETPDFAMILKLVEALGLRLEARPRPSAVSEPP